MSAETIPLRKSSPYDELSRVRAELAQMKREKDRLAQELERREEAFPSLDSFPPGMVAAAQERAKKMDGEFMTNTLYLCERWTYCPYVPDAPPINGILTPSPDESPCHPPAYTQVPPMQHIFPTLKQIAAKFSRIKPLKGK